MFATHPFPVETRHGASLLQQWVAL